MKLARNLERRLEHLVEGLAGRLFRGQLGPVEMASRMVREADLGIVQGPAGPTAPNAFDLTVNPDDVDLGKTASLIRELAAVYTATATDRGWRLDGPASVNLAGDPSLPAGGLKCDGRIEPGPLSPWGRLVETPGNRTVDLRPIRSLVGRSESADAVIPDGKVSRVHALVWQESGAVWVADLDSANGTFLNGRPVRQPTAVEPGDTLRFGPAMYSFVAG